MSATIDLRPLCLAVMAVFWVFPARADTAVATGAISIMGEGRVRASNAVTHQEIQQQAPGKNPLMVLSNVPGVSVTTADPYGLYMYGDSIEMRGFNSGQIGITVNGVPMTDNSAAGGNPVTRFVDSENLRSVTVSQGSGDLSTPSYNALGGSINVVTSDPANRFGVTGEVSGGSFDSRRAFVRADTGKFANGASAYVSASRTDMDKWRSKGNDWRKHFDAKIQKIVGENKIGLSYVYNKHFDHDFLDMSLADYKAHGRYHGLNTVWTGNPLQDQLNYTGWTNGRTDQLLSFHGNFKLSDQSRLIVTPYYQKQRGFGTYNPDVNPNTGATELTFRESFYRETRYGVTSKLTDDLGRHQLAAGLWLERYQYKNYRNWYKTINPLVSGAPDRNAVIHVDFNRHFVTDATTFYVQDAIGMLRNRLKMTVGAKTISVDRDYIDNLDNANNRSVSYSKSFLPQIGATYQLTSTEQVFGNYAENFSAPSTSVLTVGTYNPELRPEQSTNIDVGIRTQRENFDASLALYHIKYKDRILQIQNATNRYLLNADIFSNVGSITTKGLELAADWRPIHHFSVSSALTLNDSTFDQDYRASVTQWVRSAGKTVPDTPKVMLSAGANYQVGGYFVGLDGKYTGKRYATVDNSESVPGRTVFGLRAGYRAKRFHGLRNFKVQFNVENLLDKDYLSKIYTGTTTGQPTYYVGAPRAYYLTISAAM